MICRRCNNPFTYPEDVKQIPLLLYGLCPVCAREESQFWIWRIKDFLHFYEEAMDMLMKALNDEYKKENK